MNWLGLTPDAVAERVRGAAGQTPVPTLRQSLWLGGLGFCLASTAVFVAVGCGRPWMFRYLGPLGPYAVAAALFVLLGGGVLGRLVVGPGRMVRFYLLFCGAFIAYAAIWVAAYFVLGGVPGELVGSIAGTPAAGMVLAWAFGARSQAPRLVLWLTLANCAGYFLGRLPYWAIGGQLGMTLFGALFGAVFGLGLGYALYLAQAPVRRLLSDPGQPSR